MASQSQGQRHTQHQRVMAKEAPQFIHGYLSVTIFEASNLQPAFLALALEDLKMEGVDLNSKEAKEQMQFKLQEGEMYCTIEIGNMEVANTEEIKIESQRQIWNNSFNIYCAHPASSEITVSIRSKNLKTPMIGLAGIPVSKILTGHFEGWFDLVDEKRCEIDKAQVRICFQFSDARSDPLWNSGIPRDFSGVKAYCDQKTGCNVTLYQDSHLSNDFNPEIRLSNNRLYQPPRLWENVYNAIHKAKHFIYVAGWSIYVDITLIRDSDRMIPEAKNLKIGELLKKKADEGLTVLVMIWKETTIPWFKPNGFVGTHCNETWEYFKNTNVKCFLCERDVSFFRWLWLSHHQKTVILDAPLPVKGDSSCQIISFVGGVDLCDGRFDNEKHPLFRTLNTIYRDDFYQKNFPDAALIHGGPREPWHDAHSKLQGLVAWDVLDNFEKRWQKQAPKDISGKLVNIRGDPQTFPPPSTHATEESWNVQVFRSIDSNSVVGFPSKAAEAEKMGLSVGLGYIYDKSIQTAYIQAIQRAKNFIYIESQYFFGSCHAWSADETCGCVNYVPIEIALKIKNKIERGEQFTVYIVTPMWPEGEPENWAIQAMLHFNRLTMEMMYKIVAEAIKAKGITKEVHPCDYLNFFCLANRETKPTDEKAPKEPPEQGTDYWNAQKNRRTPIYVHSKLMIVDDEYVIVGSANINERSLAGNRDTEISHGSYQPQHTNEVEGKARGLVYGYRMSLWYEHFIKSYCEGRMTIFENPETKECMQKVRQIADDLWKKYVADEIMDLPGHLLPFPVKVAEDGSLSDLTENGKFPDTEAPIKGAPKPWVPPNEIIAIATGEMSERSLV